MRPELQCFVGEPTLRDFWAVAFAIIPSSHSDLHSKNARSVLVLCLVHNNAQETPLCLRDLLNHVRADPRAAVLELKNDKTHDPFASPFASPPMSANVSAAWLALKAADPLIQDMQAEFLARFVTLPEKWQTVALETLQSFL